MIWKKSLLVICKLLRHFINTLTADNMDSLLNRDNSTQQIQMQLSQKQKNFITIFSSTPKTQFKFSTFQKKKNMTVVADLFPKLRTPKQVVRSMSKKSRFRRPFQKQHGKRVKTLLKSERQYVYHIHWSVSRKLTYEKSLLVIFKIFRLFVYTFTAND